MEQRLCQRENKEARSRPGSLGYLHFRKLSNNGDLRPKWAVFHYYVLRKWLPCPPALHTQHKCVHNFVTHMYNTKATLMPLSSSTSPHGSLAVQSLGWQQRQAAVQEAHVRRGGPFSGTRSPDAPAEPSAGAARAAPLCPRPGPALPAARPCSSSAGSRRRSGGRAGRQRWPQSPPLPRAARRRPGREEPLSGAAARRSHGLPPQRERLAGAAERGEAAGGPRAGAPGAEAERRAGPAAPRSWRKRRRAGHSRRQSTWQRLGRRAGAPSCAGHGCAVRPRLPMALPCSGCGAPALRGCGAAAARACEPLRALSALRLQRAGCRRCCCCG